VIPKSPVGSHPDADALFRAHASPRTEGAAAVLAHAATCAACSTELAALEAFSANPADPFGAAARRASGAFEAFAGRPSRRPARVSTPALAIAAALLLLVGAAILVRRPAADVERGDGAAGVLSPAGILAAPPEEFRFPAIGAARVRVSVVDSYRRYSWTSPPSPPAAPVAFPPSERAKLVPGVVYTWVVLGEGSELPAQTFQIRAGAPPR
jgi:hypothetical protein